MDVGLEELFCNMPSKEYEEVRNSFEFLHDLFGDISVEVLFHGPYPDYCAGWDEPWDDENMFHDEVICEEFRYQFCSDVAGSYEAASNGYFYPFFALDVFGKTYHYNKEAADHFAKISKYSGIKEGDDVYVFRLPKNYQYGWGDIFIPGSYRISFVKKHKVTGFDENTGNYYLDGSSYGIPFFCLCLEEIF